MSNKKTFTWGKLLSWLVFLHSAAFLLFWLTNRFFYADTNNYLKDLLDMKLDYISLWLGFASLLAGWSTVRVVWPVAATRAFWQRLGEWVYVVLGIFFIVFFYGSFALLFRESPVQITRLGYMLQYHRLLIDITAWVGLVFLARKIRIRWAAGIPLLIFWFATALIPPGAVHRSLPKKPELVAHRGAAMIAPENTTFSAIEAINLNVYGLESDVRVSLDGKLFLMHDSTLIRTTDVETVYPDRATERAETFTSAELSRLNYYAWFIQDDPFGTVHSGIVEKYLGAYTIARFEEPLFLLPPTFAEWLDLVRGSEQIFIFDLLSPPKDHPFTGKILDMALAEIRTAGVENQIWLLIGPEEVDAIKTENPEIRITAGIDSEPVSAAELISEGYQIVNAEYDLPLSAVKDYHEAGLWVNLWTVDEPWLFSWLWLNGVDSVTTNNVHTFAPLNAPMLGVAYPAYLVFWIVLGLIGSFVALWRRK